MDDDTIWIDTACELLLSIDNEHKNEKSIITTILKRMLYIWKVINYEEELPVIIFLRQDVLRANIQKLQAEIKQKIASESIKMILLQNLSFFLYTIYKRVGDNRKCNLFVNLFVSNNNDDDIIDNTSLEDNIDQNTNIEKSNEIEQKEEIKTTVQNKSEEQNPIDKKSTNERYAKEKLNKEKDVKEKPEKIKKSYIPLYRKGESYISTVEEIEEELINCNIGMENEYLCHLNSHTAILLGLTSTSWQ